MAVDELHGYLHWGDYHGIMQGTLTGSSKKLVVKNIGKSSVT